MVTGVEEGGGNAEDDATGMNWTAAGAAGA